MSFSNVVKQKGMTGYKLSKVSHVPQTTVTDICSGKTSIKNCSAETVYRLAKALDVPMETLVENDLETRQSFENFKSTVCHRLKSLGDIDFIISTLSDNSIIKLHNKNWHAESLYLLAMVDYLCNKNGLPLCENYSDLRMTRLSQPLFPIGIAAMCAATNSETPRQESLKNAIPEFLQYNIIESEVQNVW